MSVSVCVRVRACIMSVSVCLRYECMCTCVRDGSLLHTERTLSLFICWLYKLMNERITFSADARAGHASSGQGSPHWADE